MRRCTKVPGRATTAGSEVLLLTCRIDLLRRLHGRDAFKPPIGGKVAIFASTMSLNTENADPNRPILMTRELAQMVLHDGRRE